MSNEIATFLAHQRSTLMCNPYFSYRDYTIEANSTYEVEEDSLFFLIGNPTGIAINASVGKYDTDSMIKDHEFKGALTIENTLSVAQKIEFLVLTQLD